MHYLDETYKLKKLVIEMEVSNCEYLCEFKKLSYSSETIKLGTYDAKDSEPTDWSLVDDFIVLAYPSNKELYVKKLDGYSWIIKPTKANLNVGKMLLKIDKLPVADNNEYKKEQYKIVYSSETSTGVNIN
jgi:hypothetical protein